MHHSLPWHWPAAQQLLQPVADEYVTKSVDCQMKSPVQSRLYLMTVLAQNANMDGNVGTT